MKKKMRAIIGIRAQVVACNKAFAKVFGGGMLNQFIVKTPAELQKRIRAHVHSNSPQKKRRGNKKK